MRRIANRIDFHQLSDEQQKAHAALLHTCRLYRLSCRCEITDRDFTIIVSPGLAAAQWWIDRLDVDVPEA